MKHLLILCCLSITSMGQSLLEFSQKTEQINKKGMLALGIWGMTNTVYAAAGAKESSFHTMNMGWGLVNTSIAAFGYFKKPKATTGLNALEAHWKSQRTFLFNSALDVSYVLSGMLMKQTSDSERMQGFGNSLILQGAFLGVFDLVMYQVHSNHYKKSKSNLMLQFKGNSVSLIKPL